MKKNNRIIFGKEVMYRILKAERSTFQQQMKEHSDKTQPLTSESEQKQQQNISIYTEAEVMN